MITDRRMQLDLRRLVDLELEVKRLRRRIDNIKIRSYELGQKELHNMALEALQDAGDE
jgi:hypothetical protein